MQNPANPRKTVLALRPSITIYGHTIHPLHSHKFLGVIIDQELRFKEHAAHALMKGTTYIMACNRMVKVTKGIKGKLMHRLFKSVVLPKMMYVADVWCSGLVSKGNSHKSRGRGARGFASKMAQVQRIASTLITGGM
ncbi:uncharacterized protein HD556DRAFT_1225119 [Suillus plorans]|uniref:Uncharacterized protein n=1 Tax=Suillus plorans TaxID=116603 RepID=A0A9P7DYB8_9AGAM|nr:uncharacterized protein HD556DRAFT_1225119 [Suillus plorans]KAG1806370.1 hypothetical protein HD556DRAFT_1225119 [Suillus plorans]